VRTSARRRIQHKRGLWLTREYADGPRTALGAVEQFIENQTGLNYFTAVRVGVYEHWQERSVYAMAVHRPSRLSVAPSAAISNVSMPSGRLFDSLDAFDRLRWDHWVKPVLLLADVVLQDHELGYDKVHNLLFKQDHLAGADHDHLATFDRLNRAVRHGRGTLNPARTFILPTPSRLEETWGLDQSANWRSVNQAVGTNPPGFRQTRRHSASHRITSFATQSGTSFPPPVHDAVGLMTRMPRPLQLGSMYAVRYDGWGRVTELAFAPTAADPAIDLHRFEYDGLGRRIVSRSWKGAQFEARHFYYDELGRVITEGLEQTVQVGGLPQVQTVLDREFVWDVNDPGRLLCRVRHVNPAAGVQERHYPLYDARGDVLALLNTTGDVVERFDYDGLGNVVYLNADFTIKPVQQSSFDWEILLGGLRRDRWNGLYAAGGAWLHPALGRVLPLGPVLVIPEDDLTNYTSDFPLGNWRQPQFRQNRLMQSLENELKWLNDQAPWIKVTVGAGALVVTAVIVGVNLEHPGGYVMLGGAIAGGIQGGVEAGLSKGDWSDVILQAGLGSLFGAITPWGAFGSLGGSLVAGVGTAALGGDQDAIATAWAWGGLIGGIAGDFGGAYRAAAKFGATRALASGLSHAGPDLLGAGAGATYGYMTEGSSTAALHYANLGMFGGGIAGGMARRLPSVRRALAFESPPRVTLSRLAELRAKHAKRFLEYMYHRKQGFEISATHISFDSPPPHSLPSCLFPHPNPGFAHAPHRPPRAPLPRRDRHRPLRKPLRPPGLSLRNRFPHRPLLRSP
jgi:YD repeat-containing protein